jgi:glycosyltransferase involved in cell wall biosynthesis
MRLSACIIVKNEASTFRATLESLRGKADEIVVVDGGSSDGSADLAREEGARVFVDMGDFSAARNRALREARGDVRLMIDADEIAVASTWEAFRGFVVERGAHPRGRILQVSETEQGIASLWVTRVCTNDPRFYYEGAVHEQLTGPGPCADTGLHVTHSGYRPDVVLRKGAVARNLTALARALEERPDDAYLNYQLGKTLLVAKRAPEAVARLSAALERLPADAAYASELGCDLGYALRHTGRFAEALGVARRFQQRFPDYTDLHFLEGICHMHLGNARAMRAAFERCLALGEAPRYATVHGVGSYRAHYNLGLFYELAGDVGRARDHYDRALTASPTFEAARARAHALADAHVKR